MTPLEQLLKLLREILNIWQKLRQETKANRRKEEDEAIAKSPADSFVDKFGPRVQPSKLEPSSTKYESTPADPDIK